MIVSNANLEKIRTEVVRNLDDLEPYADDWNQLALHAPQQIPTLSHAYISTYLEYFLEPGESWFCLLALQGDELLGVLPVVVTPTKHASFDRPLLKTPYNMHIASVDFATKEGIADRIVPILLERLQKTAPRRMGLELLRIPASSPTISVLADGVRGSTVIKEFNGRGSFLDTTGSFEEYRAALGRNFSRNLTKAKNRISRLPNIKTLFLSGTEADEKEADTLIRVEAAGWKGRTGSAILSSPLLRVFYTALARRLSKLGWLEWHILFTDDRPIAMHFAIKMGRILVINKIGFDEEFARCSPGNILFERTIQRAFDSKNTDEINCLTDMAWHDNWRMIKKDYFDLWIYPRRPIPLIYGVLPKKIRRWGRRMPALKSLYKKIRSVAKGT